MRVIEKILEFKSRRNSIWQLVPLGDIHLGHPNCDLDSVQKTIDYIKKTKNCIWLGMGDYADAIQPKDWRFDFHAIDFDFPTPDLQYREITRLFKPIKHKCIGLLDGNHDLIHWKKHAHNYVDGLAYDLKVPYLSINAYIRLIFRRKKGNLEGKKTSGSVFNIYAHHGWTGARTPGGKVNRIEDLSDIFPGLNLYLMGHVHERGSAFPRVQLFVNRNLTIKHHEMNFVFTGGFLRGYVDGKASYIEEKTYKPAALGAPLIEIKVEPTPAKVFNRPKVTVSALTFEKGLSVEDANLLLEQ